MVIYPSVEDIIYTNEKILSEIKVKKADRHEVLSFVKIETVLENTKSKKGDIYDKAVRLLKGLIQAHTFASGNRRTAFLVTLNFFALNKAATNITDKANAYIFQGIREDYYTDKEIKEWLKNGKIREFKRE